MNTPVKRPRGRPRKTPVDTPAVDHLGAQGENLQTPATSDNSERRGHPRGTSTAAAEEFPQSTPSKRVATERARRRRRGSMGAEANMKLNVPEEFKDADYVYRWVKDTPGRIKALTVNDDYDRVSDEEISEDMRQTGVGTLPERHGGMLDQGGSYNMVLLRKPRDFYEEDQAAKAADVDELEHGIKAGAVKGGLSGEHAYAPEGGISVTHGDLE